MTLTVVVNVPTRELLAGETKNYCTINKIKTTVLDSFLNRFQVIGVKLH